jgi:hypothetical protein
MTQHNTNSCNNWISKYFNIPFVLFFKLQIGKEAYASLILSDFPTTGAEFEQ